MNKKRLLTLMGKGTTTKTITSVEDTFLAMNAANANYSTENYLSLRKSETAQRNIIIKFNLSSIPVGRTLLSANLHLYSLTAPTNNSTIAINQILSANSDMVFSQMTWNIKKTGTAWAGDTGGDGGADAGCFVSDTDFNSATIASFKFESTVADNTLFNVSLDLTQTAAMIANNYGLIIFGGYNSYHGFHSTQSATVGYRPKLVIKYK